VSLLLEVQVCLTSTRAASLTASPREADKDGPSLPASISLSGPADHLQGQKPFFSLIIFFFPVTQSLGSFPCRSTETAGIIYRARPVRPDSSVTVAEVRKEAPPARDAVIFPLYCRFCPLSPRTSWNFLQRDCLLSVLFFDTCLAL